MMAHFRQVAARLANGVASKERCVAALEALSASDDKARDFLILPEVFESG